MAGDVFLKVKGIDGDSNDKNHSKWIELLGFEHGSAQTVAVGRSTDNAGRGQFMPFLFTHALDKATPKIQEGCMRGLKVDEVELHCCRAIAGVQTVVYEVKMTNVKIIKSEVKTVPVETINSDNKGFAVQQPVEIVELVAGKMTWKYTTIKPDNTKDGAVEASFDQVTNS